MRRFRCTTILASDLLSEEGGVSLPKGDTLFVEFRGSSEPNAEEVVRATFLADLKKGMWKDADLEVQLEELPPETAVTIDKILALPVTQDRFSDRTEDILNHFMSDMLYDWAHQDVELSLSGIPLKVRRRMLAMGVDQQFMDAFSIHMSEVPFAVVVLCSDGDNTPDVDVYVFDKVLAQQAATELLQARMRAQIQRVEEQISRLSIKERGQPLLDFDAHGISIVDGSVIEGNT